ncbi:MAG: hypothetical protein A3H98_08620 [Bacteroidetes bacterium RIFCSPLOWO2_02_FULL_36_8]|nr:MAG: hypothetical protein A3H98_08620 [Bacteroidetes bacterium RIFCSPLOWO2_02_FULL_36_8]OFY71511.1 MAG: hypothetical protein A3G23_04470 [Bacteroidetes bacterium RIFCSPLOWO2_12_FULL_37_12]
MKKYLPVFIFLFFSGSGIIYSQKLQPTLTFLKDSINVGEPVSALLVLKHSPGLNILMPDTFYNFSPFDFIEKKVFPTRTSNNTSTDSVIYILQTFEIDSLQRLSLPVYVYARGDCTQIYSNRAEIRISHLVHQVPNPPKLKSNNSFVEIKSQFNYPFWNIFLAITAGIALLIFIFFGKKIRRKFLIYKLNKRHKKFLKEYAESTNLALRYFKPVQIEECVTKWKEHISFIEETPLYSFTSREMIKYFKDENLDKSLHSLDKCIYGHFTPLESIKFGVTVYEFRVSPIETIDSITMDKYFRSLLLLSDNCLNNRIRRLRGN